MRLEREGVVCMERQWTDKRVASKDVVDERGDADGQLEVLRGDGVDRQSGLQGLADRSSLLLLLCRVKHREDR